MQLLHATREQLHGKPTREVVSFEVAEMAGINPYQRRYDDAVGYLVDDGYMEPYPNSSRLLFQDDQQGARRNTQRLSAGDSWEGD